MRGRQRAISLVLWVVYGAAIILPAAHEAFPEEAPCVDCEAREASGPALEAACGGSGPCEVPGHHHHRHGRAHDHAHCPVCHQAPIEGLAAVGFVLALRSGNVSRPERSVEGHVAPVLPEGSHHPRAPPKLS